MGERLRLMRFGGLSAADKPGVGRSAGDKTILVLSSARLRRLANMTHPRSPLPLGIGRTVSMAGRSGACVIALPAPERSRHRETGSASSPG
jgi:hypothetical protein